MTLFTKYYKSVILEKYALFAGRASRAEYWWFFLFNLIISIAISFLSLIIGDKRGVLGTLYILAIFIPNLALSVRRLHDIGKSGWWILIVLIPIIGTIWLVFLYTKRSEPSDNEYGPDPYATSH